jgi:hypothetical protein
VINASTDVRSTADDFVSCTLEVDDLGAPGGSRFLALNHPDSETVCPTASTVSVQSGTHKVDLEGQSADPDVKWGRGSLQVTFIPFGAAGQQP